MSEAGITTPEMEEDPCAASNDDSRQGLRIGAIFIILVTSLFGTLLPIVLRSSKSIPRPFFEFAKYFGSGVIIATAFIHLLAPAFEELSSECLSGAWNDYDWAPAIAMAAVYGIFFAEVAAYRIGTKKLAKLGVNYNSHHEDRTDAHAHAHQDGAHDHDHAHGDREGSPVTETSDISTGPGAGQEKKYQDIENLDSDSDSVRSQAEAAGQLVGVAVLEFGVVLHSVIIGLTLAVNDEFVTLFVVIIFHQMFEGLGLGSRLSALNLPGKWNYGRYVAAIFYSICTPVGVAIGLGVRESYNGNGAKASIISGVLDATSAGILLYTGLVELLAHEILLNPRAMKSSNGKMTYIFLCMLLGSGLMALLGRWA